MKQTVFSHIIQKRLSQENENVATDALAFILNSSEAARDGILKLLRNVSPNLPNLQFRTQHSVENVRPDMWGFDADSPRVYIENKFWAGLTENQPVNYLKRLADCRQPSVLLFVVPEPRLGTVWRELIKRLGDAKMATSDHPTLMGLAHAVFTEQGPILAITSWEKLLNTIEVALADDSDAKQDLLQLRSLCGVANLNAFAPLTSAELTNQRLPALILQADDVIQAAVDLAVTEGSLSIDKLNKQISNERIGRYVLFPALGKSGFGAWIGVHFTLWKEHGGSPLWLVFSTSAWGRGLAAHSVLSSWCNQNHITSFMGDNFVMAIDLPVGEEKEYVVRFIADRLKEINNIFRNSESIHR